MGKGNIGRKSKNPTPEDKKSRLNKRFSEFDPDEITVAHAWSHFIIERKARGNEKASLDAYNRFYKKLLAAISPTEALEDPVSNMPVSMIAHDAFREIFIQSLSREKPVSPQTINHYLRSYRAFGNFCEEQGYIEGFKCPIKEVDPPLKDVYTKKELETLLKEPDIEDFVSYRSYAVITLILTTGARATPHNSLLAP